MYRRSTWGTWLQCRFCISEIGLGPWECSSLPLEGRAIIFLPDFHVLSTFGKHDNNMGKMKILQRQVKKMRISIYCLDHISFAEKNGRTFQKYTGAFWYNGHFFFLFSTFLLLKFFLNWAYKSQVKKKNERDWAPTSPVPRSLTHRLSFWQN